MELTIEVALALTGVAALIVIRLNSTTLLHQETTVAAPRTSLLRESVNTVRGRAAHVLAVKVGNATPKMTATRRSGGGWAATEQRPISDHDRTHDDGSLR